MQLRAHKTLQGSDSPQGVDLALPCLRTAATADIVAEALLVAVVVVAEFTVQLLERRIHLADGATEKARSQLSMRRRRPRQQASPPPDSTGPCNGNQPERATETERAILCCCCCCCHCAAHPTHRQCRASAAATATTAEKGQPLSVCSSAPAQSRQAGCSLQQQHTTHNNRRSQRNSHTSRRKTPVLAIAAAAAAEAAEA